MIAEKTGIASLRTWRRRRLMTVRDLAAEAKTSPRTVVELEAGNRTPRVATIRALSEALGVEPDRVAEFRRAMGFSVVGEDGDGC